ncbi:elongation factor 1-beta [Pyrobaculum aerophilum]|uniref:Elongation factor 1-beta n=2 Tax=Pyrobaculum aerophilum TaxID=13773 RepID=EF1B_PYRAE|nr:MULTISPECIES: elongation factor 1-beta [Pyrobaculum]Q8ZYN5.1 RecName: Full=Elongation factor 1-beta; Short=EF-1-beta; AltName: Full=aEF-1beta [Pyrobaculum aerophilum str. IM2]AAL62958.1 translation elongation factor aEF-1 beta subunit [Pyrobaculum aerophilum str. IM2]MCX8137449.1 elongation factor 1-beta [Pyrobaculum aerophilum]RFA94227.1 elongation factor 1-beta [Pyrobaculum aerophilum]RFA95876.1 elongation factor 1-beta [Pyrobaculum aerophilum]HII46095.1 elongation factor 1-beta [Pyrobac
MSAEVALVYRVLPDSAEVNIEKLKNDVINKLAPKYKVDKVEVEEIGFGIKALRLYIRMPESDEYSSDEIEELLRSVEGVGGYELEYFSRLSF